MKFFKIGNKENEKKRKETEKIQKRKKNEIGERIKVNDCTQKSVKW